MFDMNRFAAGGTNSKCNPASTLLDLGPIAAPEHSYFCADTTATKDVPYHRFIDLAYQDNVTDAAPALGLCGQELILDYGSSQSDRLQRHSTPSVRPEHEGQTRKRSTIRSACLQCRKRKKRGFAQRPVCQYCNLRGVGCSWDAPDGLAKTEYYGRKTSEAKLYPNDLGGMVLDTTKTSSDRTSTISSAGPRLYVVSDELVK